MRCSAQRCSADPGAIAIDGPGSAAHRFALRRVRGTMSIMSRSDPHAVAADNVFDGTLLHRDHAVVIEAPRIVGIIPRRHVPRAIPVHELPEGTWLAPGFIDVQVNGGGDVLFNEQPTREGILAIMGAHRKFGTTALVPTLITDTGDKMRAAFAAVQALVYTKPSVLGIHFEGPFLSPQKPGVHDVEKIRRPNVQDEEIMTSARKGVMVVTLAPEEVRPGFIATLAGAGVRVSLGHSMASYAQTKAALAEGLTGFTHLFNAMPQMESRKPGPIAAALESNAWFGMIVDGAHVAPAMLRLALRGSAQPMLVTDAMPPVGGSKNTFTLQGREIFVRNGHCATTDGTLAGTALDMASAVRNAVRLLQMSLTDALRAASSAPANFLGLGDTLGALAPGYRADLVAFEPNEVQVLATWVAGESSLEVTR
jgi:N-acetylglucosamine-6-phosphate deacetylase